MGLCDEVLEMMVDDRGNRQQRERKKDVEKVGQHRRDSPFVTPLELDA